MRHNVWISVDNTPVQVGEGGLPEHHLVGEDTEGPVVTLRAVGLGPSFTLQALQHLRGNIFRGSNRDNFSY